MNRLMKVSLLNKVVALTLSFLMVMVSASVQAEESLYFVHTDHLGTPKVITDENQVTVWEVRSQPFGEVEIVTEQIEFNVRFPGQYADGESGLSYNYFRDYDPGLGRYVQSDPIGLRGGLNTYAYASQNPLKYIDPTGEAFVVALPWLLPAGQALVDAAVIGIGICWLTGTCSANESDECPVEGSPDDNKLSQGEIDKLKEAGLDPHDLKPKKQGSKYDLFKDKNGNIIVKPKKGNGPGDPTGININNL